MIPFKHLKLGPSSNSEVLRRKLKVCCYSTIMHNNDRGFECFNCLVVKHFHSVNSSAGLVLNKDPDPFILVKSLNVTCDASAWIVFMNLSEYDAKRLISASH